MKQTRLDALERHLPLVIGVVILACLIAAGWLLPMLLTLVASGWIVLWLSLRLTPPLSDDPVLEIPLLTPDQYYAVRRQFDALAEDMDLRYRLALRRQSADYEYLLAVEQARCLLVMIVPEFPRIHLN